MHMGYPRSWNDYTTQIARFWRVAFLFWTDRRSWVAWSLTGTLLLLMLLDLGLQFLLNYWNRNFFDALGRRDAMTLWYLGWLFIPLVGASVLTTTASVYARMTTQRKWRESMTRHVIEYWLSDNRFQRIGKVGSGSENPEYRIAEDVRIATDAPVDLVSALVSSFLTATVFFGVLWRVGGAITLPIFGQAIVIPGYLGIAVVLYAIAFNAAILFFGQRLPMVVERKNQAEARLRASLDIVRGQSGPALEADRAERHAIWLSVHDVLTQWRALLWQLVRTTLVGQSNVLVAPVMGLLLCMPKYVDGAMTLGELTQAAAAFVVVQNAFNWVVGNYQRLADWRSSAHRVTTLLLALDAAAPGEEAIVEKPRKTSA